jgi:chloramphenicol 3-O phosphotransferase
MGTQACTHFVSSQEDDGKMESGRIILLNGASSVGKTSLARALQNSLAQPYLLVGLDAFLGMLPGRYFSVNPLATADSVQGFTWEHHNDEHGEYIRIVPGAFADRLKLEMMHPAIVNAASLGLHQIIDDVLLERRWLADYVRVLRPFDVWFVEVYCPIPVLEAREKVRGDRDIGQAKGQALYIHEHAQGIYDVKVDTSLLTPQEAAEWIMAALQEKPIAFERLRTILLDNCD